MLNPRAEAVFLQNYTPPQPKGNQKPSAKLQCPRMLDGTVGCGGEWSSGSRGGISRLDWGGEKRKGKASLASVCLCNGA